MFVSVLQAVRLSLSVLQKARLYLQKYTVTNKTSDYYPKKEENTKSSRISSDIILRQKECCEKGFPVLELMFN